jgi:hypothetical protein
LAGRSQTARDGSPDTGPAAGDDGNAHDPQIENLSTRL